MLAENDAGKHGMDRLKFDGGNMRTHQTTLAIAVSLFAAALAAVAQQRQVSDSEYISQALSAAPAAVAKDAAVVRTEKDGSMRTLRPGKNGFTCMIMGTDRMCNDANSMEFIHALMMRTPPPNKVGISYMLAGDKGASNTDPYATGKTADNHWIVTGPHIMLFGPPAKTLGYTEAKDPDPTKPYMMWAGTPYEHAMIPVGPAK
jgi:outer membrane receptor for monomeric catechols